MAAAAFTEKLRPVKTCRQCGEELPPRETRKPRKFCSHGCAAIYGNKRRANHSEQALMARFWEKVDKTPGFGPDGDCWKWTARVDGRGYGEIKVAGRYKKAHRLALFGMKDLSNPLFACHRCDNPRCVRPSHLFAGTSLDNVHDMMAKGRAFWSV